jgi:hypothetical protein
VDMRHALSCVRAVLSGLRQQTESFPCLSQFPIRLIGSPRRGWHCIRTHLDGDCQCAPAIGPLYRAPDELYRAEEVVYLRPSQISQSRHHAFRHDQNVLQGRQSVIKMRYGATGDSRPGSSGLRFTIPIDKLDLKKT